MKLICFNFVKHIDGFCEKKKKWIYVLAKRKIENPFEKKFQGTSLIKKYCVDVHIIQV